MEAARCLDPDLVLMDIRMPDLDGLEATRRLLDGGASAIRVLILTTFGLNEYVYEALQAGASGFLLKDAPAEDLLAAVHRDRAGRRAARSGDHTRRHRAVRAQVDPQRPSRQARQPDGP